MKKSIFSFLALALMLTLYSCDKDSTMTDDEIIEGIIASEKQTVGENALPADALTLLNDEYTESLVEEALLAEEWGYQVDVRREVGSQLGQHRRLFFRPDGRELRRKRDGQRRPRPNGVRPNGDECTDMQECFDLIYPVTFIMPDGSEITGPSQEEVFPAIRSWYADNDGVEERPELQFPVDIEYEYGTIETVDGYEGLRAAWGNCE